MIYLYVHGCTAMTNMTEPVVTTSVHTGKY